MGIVAKLNELRTQIVRENAAGDLKIDPGGMRSDELGRRAAMILFIPRS